MPLMSYFAGLWRTSDKSLVKEVQHSRYLKTYSKNISDVKKGEPKKVQATERLKGVKSL